MHVVYAPHGEPPEVVVKSMMLCGPTPRSSEVPSWRPEALRILEAMPGTEDLTVYVPESADGTWKHSYDDQREWEKRNLHRSDIVFFWVPRHMETMPALTTNVEWGTFHDSGRAVLAYPKDAPHMRYMTGDAADAMVPVASTLADGLAIALTRLGEGDPRVGGERDIPLSLWTLPSFRAWHEVQKRAGNRLDSARVLFTFRVGYEREATFLWIAQVKVWVTAEGRFKSNEFVLARPDISALVAYRVPDPPPMSTPEEMAWRDSVHRLLSTEVVLVREYRSTSATHDGFIREVPGGSDLHKLDPIAVAVEEFRDECGLDLNPGKLRYVSTRQMMGTLSAHRAHLYAVEVSAEQMAWLKAQRDRPRGIAADTERTYVEVYRLGDILANPSIDHANLGMIAQALLSAA